MARKTTKQDLQLLRDDLRFVLGIDAEDEFLEILVIEINGLQERIHYLEKQLGV